MTTVRYARYVLINEEGGVVAWYESQTAAEEAQAVQGGDLFDTETDDPENIEIILYHARKKMGVE